MATQYQVNYEDERFKNVETEKQAALNESNSMYNEMIGNSDKYYQSQIDAVKGYADQQKEIQEQNTQFAIEQVNQQKEQAKMALFKPKIDSIGLHKRAKGSICRLAKGIKPLWSKR